MKLLKLGNILICLVLASSANVGTTFGKPLSDKNDANHIQPLMTSNAEEIIRNSDIDEMNIEETKHLETTTLKNYKPLYNQHLYQITVSLVIVGIIMFEIIFLFLCLFTGYFDPCMKL